MDNYLQIRLKETCYFFFFSFQISVGIGNEVRESAVQLSQMVRFVLQCFSSSFLKRIERRVRRNGWHPRRHSPTDEQHGRTTGLSLVMVHRFSCHRFLVFHSRLVASTVNQYPCLWLFSVGIFFCGHRSLRQTLCPYSLAGWKLSSEHLFSILEKRL